MDAECSLKPRSTPAQRKLFGFGNRMNKEIASRRSPFICSNAVCRELTNTVDRMLTSRRIFIDAPVAQRIEHLPCWSLNGEVRLEPIEWTTLYAGTP